MTFSLGRFLLGDPIDAHLPERVLKLAQAQQFASERLVGWVQLTLVTFMGLLWAISPPAAAQAVIQPVPVALSIYLLFTSIRIWAAHREWLPDWFLIASAVIDMVLLMVLIWSFHIKYDQPPSFYLKAPTLLYVFIFIALRALRFEPKYVIISGLAAALGWTVLMLHVVSQHNVDPMITRDFVVYMTSNSVLIGAEVDKIISILFVTFVLAIAVERARRTVYHAVAEQTAARDLSRFVSEEVAQWITSADRQVQPGDGELRIGTTVFTDIEGFSTFSERLSPKGLADTMNAYFAVMDRIIRAHGGVITQFQGDAMLITFNAITEDPNHAANALKMALEMQRVCSAQTFGTTQEVLKTRFGVNTGKIIVGAVGAKDRLVFTVHGDDVNIAARLEQLNKEFGSYIMTTAETLKAAGDSFDAHYCCEPVLKGRTEATQVYTLDGLAAES